ncbi:MAG: Rv1355c family protein [Flavobacteriales bacterium]|nr:Rv1355c family protein [Flavobacteriales bacterium]
MDALLEALKSASEPDRDRYRPEFFRVMMPDDRRRMEELLKRGGPLVVHDELEDQLAELVRSLEPSRRFTPAELAEAVRIHLNGVPVHAYGVWVYYPWSCRLVHLLDEQEFAQVRTDRNRNKITAEEQALLSTKKIGVIGLSVGQSVCLTLALERSFGELRIADHDTLDLSNLNRIRSGAASLGHLKTINVAREIAEIDPFLKVTLFSNGLTSQEEVDDFLLNGGRLDVLVDECDSVGIKILARLRARAHRIPVVMDTSDRGMLDIERFDLEPERSIMHGSVDHLDLSKAMEARTQEEKLPFVVPMTGLATLSKRMKASMLEIGQSVSTWPQLASSVVLGGAVTGDLIRRICLGTHTDSGRWFMDIESLIPDHRVDRTPSTDDGPPPSLTSEEMIEMAMRAAGSHSPISALSQDECVALAEAGRLAPSGGNDQPWRFLAKDGRLYLFHDAARSYSRTDEKQRIGTISMGACVENVLLRASSLGIGLAVDLPEGMRPLVAIFQKAGRSEQGDPLAKLMADRCTNRRKGDRCAFPADHATALKRAIVEKIPGVGVHVLDRPEELETLARLVGEAERLRFLNPVCHEELFNKEVRWTEEEAKRTLDGLDLGTFELTPGERLAMSVASDPEAIALLNRWDAGGGFQNMSGPAIRSSSAVAMITVPDHTASDLLAGGRAMQRLWLKATELGWSAHPVSAPILMDLVKDSPVFTARERSAITKIAEQLLPLRPILDQRPLFLLRLFRALPPSKRSLRLPLSDILFTSRPSNLLS